jgi:hypothetical protein
MHLRDGNGKLLFCHLKRMEEGERKEEADQRMEKAGNNV